MEITHWKFEFETSPSLIGISVYGVSGIVGFFLFGTRVVFLPVAFFAGMVAGILSSSHAHTGNNGIIVSIAGFLLIMLFSASQHVSSLTDSNDLILGDQLFFALAIFLAEAFLSFVTVLPLGYFGAQLIGIIRKKRQPYTEPRNLGNLR